MSITSGTITITGFEQIDEILELEVVEKPSRHPKARFRASIVEGADITRFYTYNQDNMIKITGTDNETQKQSVLFSGYIETLNIHDMGADYYELEVELLGASCKMDQDKRNRSFQDVSMTHEDVVKKAGSSTPGTSITWNGNAASSLQMPVIQYMETDWEFILRMASIYHNSIYVNAFAEYPVLSVGMELSDSGVEFTDRFYRVGVSKRFYELGGKRAGLVKSKFQYYQLTSREQADIGQYVTFQGMKLAVCEKKTRLTESEVKYTYRLSTPDYGSAKTIYNTTFIGHTILGKVIETQGETLKLDLDLSDDEHNDSVAYPYNWTPETGNIMYCMPKTGTKVSLYFSDQEESSGTVVNCIRANGGTSAKMDNPSNKHFTSEDGLLMDLNLGDMHFSTSEDKAGNAFSRLFLADNESITFETAGSLTITANQSVQIESKFIFIGAANGEVVLIGSVGSTPASLYFHYQFDSLGDKTGLTGTEPETNPPIKDEPLAGKRPEKKKVDGWGIFGKVMAGLAAAALATAAVCLCATGLGAGAGVVLGIAAAGMVSGAFAVGSMAVDEARGGEPKSLKQYVTNGFVQGFFGAASTAIGGPLGKGGKFIVEMAATAGSTVLENKILGKDATDGLGLSMAISAVTFGIFDTGVTKHIPGLNKLSDALESASSHADDVGGKAKDAIRKVWNQGKDVSAAKAAQKSATQAAETAVREEAEKAAKEEVSRAAERAAKQARNRLRNQGASREAKAAANSAYSAAKQARRAAVNEHTVASVARQSAADAVQNATADVAAKQAAKTSTKNALKSAAKPALKKELGYNSLKSSTQKAIDAGVQAAAPKLAPYLEGAKEYIEAQFSGTEGWAEE